MSKVMISMVFVLVSCTGSQRSERGVTDEASRISSVGDASENDQVKPSLLEVHVEEVHSQAQPLFVQMHFADRASVDVEAPIPVKIDITGPGVQESFEHRYANSRQVCPGCDPYVGAPANICDDPCYQASVDSSAKLPAQYFVKPGEYTLTFAADGYEPVRSKLSVLGVMAYRALKERERQDAIVARTPTGEYTEVALEVSCDRVEQARALIDFESSKAIGVKVSALPIGSGHGFGADGALIWAEVNEMRVMSQRPGEAARQISPSETPSSSWELAGDRILITGRDDSRRDEGPRSIYYTVKSDGSDRVEAAREELSHRKMYVLAELYTERGFPHYDPITHPQTGHVMLMRRDGVEPRVLLHHQGKRRIFGPPATLVGMYSPRFINDGEAIVAPVRTGRTTQVYSLSPEGSRCLSNSAGHIMGRPLELSGADSGVVYAKKYQGRKQLYFAALDEPREVLLGEFPGETQLTLASTSRGVFMAARGEKGLTKAWLLDPSTLTVKKMGDYYSSGDVAVQVSPVGDRLIANGLLIEY